MSARHARVAAVTLSAAFVALVVACGGSNDAGTGSSGGSSGGGSSGAGSSGSSGTPSADGGGTASGRCDASRATAPKGYLQGQKLVVSDVKDPSYANRTYDVFVPDAEGSAPLPVVLAFHGNGGDGDGLRAAFGIEKAAGGHAIFVYPDGFGGWDLTSALESNDDMRFVKALVAEVSRTYCVDTARVFAAGFSNGAYFANQLGCKVGAPFLRGIASHSGGGPFSVQNEYDANGNLICAGQPVPAAILHGDADGEVALSEGQGSLDEWRRMNTCASGTSAFAPSPCVTYDGCARPTVWCQIPGLGHAIWPQAGGAIWSFFASL